MFDKLSGVDLEVGCGIVEDVAVVDVVVDLEEASVVEAEVLVLGVAEGAGCGEEAGGLSVDDF